MTESSESLPQVAGYQAEAVLGRGGMGVVYRAIDVRLGRRVALKLLSDELSSDEAFRARFVRESRLAASIDHAHIVPVYEAGDADGVLYLAMRFVDGSDLSDVLRREQPLGVARALDVAGQLADALDAAHERGLIHRDVKPSNALVARESGREHVYLADFGLTKSAGSHSVTSSGQLLGTVLYMAPEVIRGEDATPASDQYALGCLLYECLTGHAPFEGPNEAAVIYGHLESPAPSARERVAGLPPRLDAAIRRALAKDPAARWPSCAAFVAAARGTAAPDARVPRSRRRRRGAVVAAAGVAAIAAAVVLLTGGDQAARKLTALHGNAAAVIEPDGGLRAQVDLDAAPADVAAGGGAVWVADQEGTVSRVDPETHTIRQTIRVGHGPSTLAADRTGVWVANRQDGTLGFISAETNELVEPKRVAGAPSDVCLTRGAVWVADAANSDVVRVDPDSGHRRALHLDAPADRVACGEGAVWASSESRGTVTQIDPASGRTVRTIDVGTGAGALAAGAHAVWVASPSAGTVSRIDPVRGAVTATIPLGRDDGPAELAVGPGGVWVANRQANTLAQIDPGRAVVARTLQLGNPPQAVAIVDGRLWALVSEAGTGHRGGTLRVVYGSPLGAKDLDPAIAYFEGAWYLLLLAHDGLLAFTHTGGRGGDVLVPDLATAMPEISDGGRTYAFTLRRGIRFSDGRTLRAGDVKASLERAAAAGPPAADFFAAVKRIDADDPAGTVTLRLSRPDPELLYKLAGGFGWVVPAGSPPPPAKTPLPGTGPYRITQWRGDKHVRLERNPFFRSWSPAARPDGYADAIVADVVSPAAAIKAVRSGAADSAASLPLPVTRLAPDLRRTDGRQLHEQAQNTTTWFWLNTTVAPFNRVDARRAVAYAIARDPVVKAAGGASTARPTCRILPPGLPGYSIRCPYGNEPDLARARALVRRSGTAGARVTVWAGDGLFASAARRIAPRLRSIGYRVQTKVMPVGQYFDAIHDPATKAQAGLNGWGADYPAPSNFVTGNFTCAARAVNNTSQFCDPVTERLVRRANRLGASEARAANDVWRQLDERILDQGAAIPLYNEIAIDFVSARLGNYQYNPQWGLLLDQAWVR